MAAVLPWLAVTMPRSSRSPRQRRLCQLLRERREAAGLTQAAVAHSLARPQSYVAKYENGERRLDVIELLEVAAVLNLDVAQLMADLLSLPRS